MFSSLPQFYQSTEWRTFRAALIGERMKRDGAVICEFSGKMIVNNYDIVLHHIKPLTMQNVNDYSVSLNPENIMIVCQEAHNEIHKRFGYCTERKVYLVWGSPGSGKSTFVNSLKGNSDLVVDMDLIWQCITGHEKYCKPKALKQNAFALRDCLVDQVKTRAGRWEKAWVLTGGALRGERERMAKMLGAELIHIDTDRETCLSRIYSDNGRTQAQKDEWAGYVDKWWQYYQPETDVHSAQ